MFGWLKKLTGGARGSVAPPEICETVVPDREVDPEGARMSAPLIFTAPANIDPFETMFGIVRLARKEEVWPDFEGEPLLPLLQINLGHAPVVPAAVRDLSLITLFISKPHSSTPTPVVDSQNPDPDANWVLRSYASTDGLTIPKPPVNRNKIIPRRGEWGALREEWPAGAPQNTPPEVITTVIDGVKHYEQPYVPPALTKLGGWPYLRGAAPWWADPSLPDTWDFVMQIENETKANWFGWGALGAASIARSRQRPHLWAIDVMTA